VENLWIVGITLDIPAERPGSPAVSHPAGTPETGSGAQLSGNAQQDG
jgi:hypothetical protein